MSDEIEKLERRLKRMRKKERKRAKRALESAAQAETQPETAVALRKPETPSALKSGTSNPIAALMPRNMPELRAWAEDMSHAGPAIGQAFRTNPGACAAITLQAVRLKVDPFSLSREAYLVNGNISFSGKMIAGIVQNHPSVKGRLRYEYEGEAGEPYMSGKTMRRDGTRRCTVSGYFHGDPDPFVLTTPPLSDIKIQNSPLWANDPDQQLAYYAVRAWARRYAPGIMSGLISEDEAVVQGELDAEKEDTRSNTEKRLAMIAEQRAAAEAEQVDTDIEEAIEDIEEIIDDDVGTEPPPDTEALFAEEDQADEQAPVKDKSQIDMPLEAHDWFEVLDMADNAEALAKMWEKQKKLPWIKEASKQVRDEINRRNQEKLDELTGE